MKRFIVVLLPLFLLGCGSVARVAQPAAVYDEVSVETYAAAENSFAGVEAAGEVRVTYWSDEKCQQMTDKRDGCLIAIAAIGAVTGAGGLTVALPTDASKNTKTVVGYTTLALAATVAALTLAVSQMNTKLGQWCRLERPVPDEHPAADEVELAPPPDELSAIDGGVGN